MSAVADLAVSWARVGLLGFGGGSSMVPLMHAECVDLRAWMSDDEFLDALALGNTLPGPIAAKMSIYVGLQVAGWAGAAVAFAAVMGPSSILMVALASAFFRYKELPAVQGAMRAVKPVVVGLLFWTAIDLAPAGIKDWRMALLAALSVAVLLAKVNPLLVMLAALGLGALFFR
jgi:chromate transporter